MFFQAKDGIRNVAVTGVQTCALPISRRSRAHSEQGVAFASRMSSITSPIDVCSIRYSQPRSSQVLARSEEHTSELQSRLHLVCRLLLEKKKNKEIAD